jgi:hypothetical protein
LQHMPSVRQKDISTSEESILILCLYRKMLWMKRVKRGIEGKFLILKFVLARAPISAVKRRRFLNPSKANVDSRASSHRSQRPMVSLESQLSSIMSKRFATSR